MVEQLINGGVQDVPKPNKNQTPQEMGLIKGAIRRVYSRCETRRKVLKKQRVNHSDPERKRVKTWYKCQNCSKFDAAAGFEVDHIDPVIPLELSFEKLTWDEYIDRIWCDPKNLWLLCLQCHKEKSSIEKGVRAQLKNGVKV